MKANKITEVLNALPVPLVAFRLKDGAIMAYNRRANEMLLIENKKNPEFAHLFPSSAIYGSLYAAIANLSAGDMLDEHILELRKMNGRKISVSVSFAVQEMDGQLLCFFSMLEDKGTQYLKTLVQLAQRLRKVQAPLERLRTLKKKSGGVISASALEQELSSALEEIKQLVKLFELKI